MLRVIDPVIEPLPPVEDPVIVDLFAGPGGLDVAAQWLDIPSIGIELDEAAIATRDAAGLSSLHADVTMWGPTDFTKTVNVLAGGPPCQTYTVAGNGHGRRALDQVIDLVARVGNGDIEEVMAEVSTHSDPRTGLVLQPLIWAMQAIKENRPFEAILLEQVPAVKPVWEAMAAVLRSKGYGAAVEVVRTEEYGVPQTRRRAILIARRNLPSSMIGFPQPTHQKYVGTAVDAPPVIDTTSSLPLWISMAEALGTDVPFTVVSNYGSGGDPKNRSRRRHDRPAFTVTGKISRNRMERDDGREDRFGPADAGVLQTFPKDYPWDGRDIAQQIGNAIPPRLGTHILNHLLGRGTTVDEEFFQERVARWVPPDEQSGRRIRGCIARQDVVPRPYLDVIAELEKATGKLPTEQTSADDGSHSDGPYRPTATV